jgi:hypothetical protein
MTLLISLQIMDLGLDPAGEGLVAPGEGLGEGTPVGRKLLGNGGHDTLPVAGLLS